MSVVGITEMARYPYRANAAGESFPRGIHAAEPVENAEHAQSQAIVFCTI